MWRGTLMERFKEKVGATEPGGCVPWLAAKNKHGYGWLRDSGRMHLAHRVAWTLAYGPVPDGLCVLHACDRPWCVNVAHLSLGTHLDNVADCVRKGRTGRGRRPSSSGELHSQALLTESDVRRIRKLAEGGARLKALALKYGVRAATISAVVRRRTWRHVA